MQDKGKSYIYGSIQFILPFWLHKIYNFFLLQVYHPNIDLEGNVCLNILREDWKPVLNINTVIYGLILLFMVFLVQIGATFLLSLYT